MLKSSGHSRSSLCKNSKASLTPFTPAVPKSAPCAAPVQQLRQCPLSSNLHQATSLNRRLAVFTIASASMSAAAVAAASINGSKDLLVVGPGVLGGYAGMLWRQANPSATIAGQTNSTTNHERVGKLGLTPVTKDALETGRKFPYVLFSAPPSGSADYAAEVKAALARWDSSAPGASFVFTSSMSVCSVDDGSTVTEDCPLVPEGKGPGTDKLLQAEKAVLEAGGSVVRLVGLYHAQRGAHTYFLKLRDVPRPGDYVVNLLHYEDAARLSVAVLAGEGSGPFRGRVFLGCDNHPVKFRDMMDACLKSEIFAGQPPVNWTQPDIGPGNSKRADNTATRQALGGWEPKYDSFEEFMTKHGGKDFYTMSGIF